MATRPQLSNALSLKANKHCTLIFYRIKEKENEPAKLITLIRNRFGKEIHEAALSQKTMARLILSYLKIEEAHEFVSLEESIQIAKDTVIDNPESPQKNLRNHIEIDVRNMLAEQANRPENPQLERRGNTYMISTGEPNSRLRRNRENTWRRNSRSYKRSKKRRQREQER